MLGENAFASTLPRYYVLIDKLDDDWVDNKFRYKLIKALVETLKEINQRLVGVKVAVAIRRDLLDRVIHETRDSGFQEEKYDPLLLHLKWTKEQLFEMLNRRVSYLVRRRYTGHPVTWSDLMPARVHNQPTDDYLIERTMYRPRDLIVFFNLCIAQAEGKPDISAQMILHAEGEYSGKRLRSLFDEWHDEFPELERCLRIFNRTTARFPLSDINLTDIEELCLGLATTEDANRGALTNLASAVAESKKDPGEFLHALASVLYRIGFLGLKIGAGTAESWSFRHAPIIPPSSISDAATAYICPMFWRSLGIKPPERR